MSASTLAVPGVDQRSAGLPVLARPVTAVALVLGPLALAVSNAGYALATREGGEDLTGAGAVALAGEQPGFYRLSVVAALVACLLLPPAALAAARLAATRARVLAGIGGYLMALGFICYFGVAFAGFSTLAAAEHGAGLAEFATISDAASDSPWAMWVFILFILGNLLGTAVLAVALMLSRRVPVWGAALVLSWPVLHVVGLIVGVEWFEVTGALLLAIGFAQVARALPKGGQAA